MGTVIRSEADSIGNALFGATRQSVLRLFFMHADERYYQRQIIRLLDIGSGSVQRELGQLTDAGILKRTVEGIQIYYQVNRNSPIYEDLRGLVRKTFGAVELLRSGLEGISDRVRLAFVYGSLAAGTEKAASDIDLMIIGDEITSHDVVGELSVTERETGREINPSVYGVQEFCRKLADGNHFLKSVVDGPKLFVIGNDADLARLAQERMADSTQNKPARNRRSVSRR
jgi:hypothetical protein